MPHKKEVVVKKKYWKVCRKNRRSEFVSCTITGKLALVYRLGRWTVPTVGKCFVFSSKRLAENYVGGGCCVIFPCEVKNPKLLEWCSLFWESMWKVRCFWNKTGHQDDRMITPTGTLGADAVKILPDPERSK